MLLSCLVGRQHLMIYSCAKCYNDDGLLNLVDITIVV